MSSSGIYNPNALYVAVRTLLQRDSDPYKAELVEVLLRKNKFYALLGHALKRSPLLVTLASALYLITALRSPRLVTGPATNRLIAVFPSDAHEAGSLTFIQDSRLGPCLLTLRRGFSLRLVFFAGRSLKMFYRLARRNPFYQVLRVARLLGVYSRLRTCKANFQGVIATSDSQPESLALLAYADATGLKTMFVSHGEPQSPSGPRRFDLGYLKGRESLDRYRAGGIGFEKVVFQGHREQLARPRLTEPPRRIGIFLGKSTPPKELEVLTRWIQAEFPHAALVIRSHPRFGHHSEREPVRTAVQEARDCDLVFAPNTTSHLEALLSGSPSVYFGQRDGRHWDRYGYVASGLVPAWRERLNWEQITAFYSKSDSFSRLAAHLDLQQTRSESNEEFLRELAKNLEIKSQGQLD
jgi:hypothetical protein